MTHRGRRRAAATILLVLVAAACSAGTPVGEGDPGVTRGGQRTVTTQARPCKEAAGFTTDVQDRGSQPIGGPSAKIDAGDFFFAPTCTTDAVPGAVTLTVHNSGQALHNVTIADQNIDQDVQAGQTITVQVNVGAAPVQYFCKYHRTSGMVGAVLPAAS